MHRLADYIGQTLPFGILTLSDSQARAENCFPDLPVNAVNGLRGLDAAIAHFAGARVINFHLYSRLVPAVCLARRRQRLCVSTLHMPLRSWSWRHRQAWRAAVGLSHAAILVCTDIRDEFGAEIARKMPFVASGPLPDKLQNRPGFHVVSSGRLEREKDFSTLLRALAGMDQARLTIVGEGSLRNALEAQARSLRVDVTFAGHLPHTEAFALLQQGDVFVLPSLFEGLGMSAIEAMALDLPVVTSDFPAARDYILPQETGFTFRVGDSEGLCACLNMLRHEPALRRRIAAAGGAFARSLYAPERQFAPYLELLRGGARPTPAGRAT